MLQVMLINQVIETSDPEWFLGLTITIKFILTNLPWPARIDF